jgi:hypothetical protein
MALSTSEICRFSAAKRRELCSEEGIESEGPVRLLRQRLVRHWKVRAMASKLEARPEQASDQTDVSSD